MGLGMPSLIGTHKRLRAFTREDFDYLREILFEKNLLLTPNALTEVSNLSRQGVSEPGSSYITKAIGLLIDAHFEKYVPSKTAVASREFSWLGLADTVWLDAVDSETEILTVDAKLHMAALSRGLLSTNFRHLRDTGST